MINDAAGRLAKELSDVAHQSQLTWPEFKRDPFGFTNVCWSVMARCSASFLEIEMC